MPPLPPGSPLEKFFHDFMNHDQGGNAPPPPDRLQSLGSGFIIDPSGLIVTNNHVIAGAQQITVTLHDGTVLPATLVGHDERMDLALLRVHAKGPLPAVAFGDSDHIRVGDWVLAIGNPFGLGGTVTAGIVSARGRNLNEGPYDDFIQTDAPINRGNSGGPLFDMAGQVIGINTAIFSPSGGSVGIGFSIPSNIAEPVLAAAPRVRPCKARLARGARPGGDTRHRREPRAQIGRGRAGRRRQCRRAGGEGGRQGRRCHSFLRRQTVKDMHALPLIVAETTIGASVPVEVWRHGKTDTLKATVAELQPETKAAATTPAPNAAPPETAIASLGLSLAPLSAKVRDQYHLGADQKGVVVTAVSPGGPAAARGLKPGDVVLEVQQQEVSSPADVVERLDAVRREGRPLGPDADPAGQRDELGAAAALRLRRLRQGLAGLTGRMAPRVDPVRSDPSLPEKTAVLVIGGGIIGTATAFFLARKGVPVVLCEKGEIGAEQSSRNWGWCRKMGRDPREIPLVIESLRLWGR